MATHLAAPSVTLPSVTTTRSPAPLVAPGDETPAMLKDAHGPGPIRSALRRLRAWWSEVGRKMDERWPDEPEDNLPDR